jgi:hypothetical protein
VDVPYAHGLARPAREVMAYGEGWVSACRVGPVGPDPKKDSIEKLIFEFQLNLDFGKTLRISTSRFRRNLDIRIFLNFF